MIKRNICVFSIFALVLLCSCGNSKKGDSLADQASGDMVAYENSDVNAVTQALPIIMILPSDQNLQRFNAIEFETASGRNFVVRDYQKYLIADGQFRNIVSIIQGSFNEDNYPLQDFEQVLKNLNTQSASDMVDNLQQDAKTLLLQTARPDIVLELDYSLGGDDRDKHVKKNNTTGVSRQYFPSEDKNITQDVSYTLRAIDVYSGKVIATCSRNGRVDTDKVNAYIEEGLQTNLPALKSDIVKYFSDLLKRGREVTVRVTVANGSNQKLSDESVEGGTYTDYIIDYVKVHTVKGAYKMQTNTANELYLVNVRIPMLQEDGTQYGVYDWTRDLIKAMRSDLGLKVMNQSQGLGAVELTIEGIN